MEATTAQHEGEARRSRTSRLHLAAGGLTLGFWLSAFGAAVGSEADVPVEVAWAEPVPLQGDFTWIDVDASVFAPKVEPVRRVRSKAAAEVPLDPTGTGVLGEGRASWYGPGFAGRPTANGEIYDPEGLTAAHRTLPMGTRVKVTNLVNQRSVVVRINDRGPFIEGRVIDLSQGAARELGMLRAGVVPVRVERVE